MNVIRFLPYIRIDDRLGNKFKRSVPNAIDGLKPSQRKVLYTLMQRFEKSEVRVVQLAGAVAHSCAYHHGEVFL